MPKEMYIFLGAIVGALAAYITARITGRNQIRIAEIGANKDIQLQEERLFDDRVKSEVCREREKLEKLHIILSTIELENSLTMSNIQSSSKMTLNDFRTKYLENCARLHEAQSISDIYYPEMSESLGRVYGQSNIFWGYQEGVLRTDINENNDIYMGHLQEVLAAGKEISKHVRELQYQIVGRSKELNMALQRTSR
jgi:hypothetical protein